MTRTLAAAALAAALITAGPAAAKTITRTYRMGPVELAPYTTNYDTTLKIPHPHIKGSLIYMHSRVVDAHGKFVPQHIVMLHHVAFVNDGRFDGDKSQYYCENGYKERFYGTGEENESLLLPPGYGYRVRPDDRWHASWMLMNHRWSARKVYVEYTLKMDVGWSDVPVKPYWLGVAPCPRDPIFEVPGGGAPGSSFNKSYDWKVPQNGRIVAVGTHLHGGAKAMQITEPACGNRVITSSQPQYGLPNDPIYHVLPMMHEPNPRFDTYPMTATGIPIRKGETYRVTATYDNELPHSRVMGIMHAYVAPATAPVPKCAPLPTDITTTGYDKQFTTTPPKVDIPLARRGSDGRAHAITTLPGQYYRPHGDAIVRIKNFRFSHPKVVINRGRAVRWIYSDPVWHDVTTANGPTAIGSQHLKNGEGWHKVFTRPGTYQLYCTLHPLDMHEIVVVR